MTTKSRLSPAMRQALWMIQKDGGLILTLGTNIETPYTTKAARPIHMRTALALIAVKALRPEAELFPGEQASSWVVSNPVDQEAV